MRSNIKSSSSFDNNNKSQQQPVTAQTIIIPISQVQKYYKFMGLPPKPYQHIEYRQSFQNKPKTVWGAYSSQSLIKLLHSLSTHSTEFMQILAINTTLSKQNKKEFVVDRMLREYCEFSYEDVLQELHHIREELRDKQLYEEMIAFVKEFIGRAKFLLYKYCETLVMVQGECLNFYVRRRVGEKGKCEYSVVMGLDRVCVSYCSSNDYCENIVHGLVAKLREHCAVDGYSLDQKEFAPGHIVASHTNFFDVHEIPEHFVTSSYEKKQAFLQQKILLEPHAQVLYTTLMLTTLTKYAQDLFFFIQGTIVFLANLVLQKKQLKSIAYDQQYISTHHPTNPSLPITETFMNLYCQHFQGLPEQLYKNGTKCPYCSQPIIVDEIKCFERNRNIFQVLLARNYLNPKGEDVVYYFRDKIFSLATKDRFSSYAHFCQFVMKRYFVRDRPEVLMLLENQRVTLYSKLWGKKRLFSQQQLIQTPVRGKYCRHLQFFQLIRVYQQYTTRSPTSTSFQCFLCYQQIEYTQIMYLHQIKLLIDLARHNFYTEEGCLLNSYVEINHTNESVELCCELEKGYMRKVHGLPVYGTLVDPLARSERRVGKGEGKKEGETTGEEGEFQYTEEFSNFFFGY